MVADVHRTLLYGGIFGYPDDKKSKDGEWCFLIALTTATTGIEVSRRHPLTPFYLLAEPPGHSPFPPHVCFPLFKSLTHLVPIAFILLFASRPQRSQGNLPTV
jgi:hypothetical protein